MTEPLRHDPRTKQQIKDALYLFLYQPVLDQFNKRLEAIILKNAGLLGSAWHVFSYKGETYALVDGQRPRKVDRLAKSLHGAMDAYLKEVKELNSQELPYVLGFIGQVLNSSNALQDYLKVFPPAVHLPIEQMIASCPCNTGKLSQNGIERLQSLNEVPIVLMKNRLVLNLLI